MKAVPEHEQTLERLEKITSEVAAQREGRITEALDEVDAVLTELNLDPGIVSSARKSLKNRSAFTARIK